MPLDRVMVSSCRLSVVTVSLSAAVWPQFAMQVYLGALSEVYVTFEVIFLGHKAKLFGLSVCFANMALAPEVWPWPKSQGQNLGGLACSRPTQFTF